MTTKPKQTGARKKRDEMQSEIGCVLTKNLNESVKKTQQADAKKASEGKR